MGLEGLFSELFVASILDGVHLESVGVAVYIMVLGEKVADRVECCLNETHHAENDSGVRGLNSGKVSEILRNVVSHLRSTGRGSIFILNHSIVQLRGHSNDHMIEVGVIVSALGDIETEGGIVVIPSEQVVGVVDQSWGVGVDLGELRRPDTVVGVLGLMDGEVRCPHSIMDHSLSVIPFLEEVTSILLMSGMDSGGILQPISSLWVKHFSTKRSYF